MKPLSIVMLLPLFLATVAFSQTAAVDIPITVSDGASGSQELRFGLDPSATDGMNAGLGEEEQPPMPPTGAFAARFVGTDIGLNLGQGVVKDYRQGTASTNGSRVHELQYQPGAGTAITISWNLPAGVTGRLQDVITGTLIDVSMSGTGSYVVNNPSIYNKLFMTVTYAFASSSVLNVTVLNTPGWFAIQNMGEVHLRNSGGAGVDTVTTNASGVGVFPSVLAGSGYQYGVYYVPTNPNKVLGREFWGRNTGLTVGSGQTVNETFQRNMPHTSSLTVYNKGTGADVTGGVVAPGTTLRLSLGITNPSTPGSGSQNVKGKLILDRSKTTSYDFNQTSAAYQTVAAGATSLFEFEYTPVDTGGYYRVPGAIAEVGSPWGSGETLTEAGAWISTPLFSVRGSAPPTTYGMITTQVIRDGDDAILGSATVELLLDGQVIDTLRHLSEYPFTDEYWRIDSVDATKAYTLRCIPPAEYGGNAVFSYRTYHYGQSLLIGNTFEVKPSDYTMESSPWNWHAYPRQFFVHSSTAMQYGMITTQVALDSDRSLLGNATVELLLDGQVIDTLRHLSEYPFTNEYWRVDSVDASKTFTLRCRPPAAYSGRAVFSYRTYHYGQSLLIGNTFEVKPSDYSMESPPWNWNAYPRQFYVHSSTAMQYGMITTQLLRDGDLSILGDATIELLLGGQVIDTLRHLSEYPFTNEYWRVDSVDASKTFALRCFPPAGYTSSPVFSYVSYHYGDSLLLGNTFDVKPGDYVMQPSPFNWEAFPRQFFVTTSLNIAVQNTSGWPAIENRGVVHLRTSGGAGVDTVGTNSSGVATFTGFPAGTGYQYGVYYVPTSSGKILGTEYWGRKTGISAGAGQAVNETFQKNTPHTSALRVYNKGTGAEVTGGIVSLGTTLRVTLEITNPSSAGSGSQNVKGRVILDRSKSSSYDFDQTSATYQTMAAGTTKLFEFEFTPVDTGGYYRIPGAYADIGSPWGSGQTLTEAGAWITSPLFSVRGSGVSSLTVIVQNVSGLPEIGETGEVQLRTSGGAGVDTAGTNAIGVASFVGIPAGTGYQYGVYHMPTSPGRILGREYWGGKTGVAVGAGQAVNETFQRNMPYTTALRVYDKSTGVDVTGGVVTPGTTLRLSLEIVNPSTSGSASQNVKGRVILDRNKASSHDFDQTSAASQTMALGTTRLFEFEYTPVDTGGYYRVRGAIAEVAPPWGSGATLTDEMAWSQGTSFTVRGNLPLAPTLASPADGATGVSTSPLLSWNTSAGATSYRIQLSGDLDFDPLAYDSTGILTTNHVAMWLSGASIYYWRVSASSNWGSSGFSAPRQFTTWTSPYNGVPINIPGVVEAESFDAGGEGITYHDADLQNDGQACRTLEGVDIVRCQDPQGIGYNITSTQAGEWLRYSVKVAQTGTYVVEARVALGASTEGQFHLAMRSTDISGPIRVAPTGGWQAWTTVKDTVVLAQGANQLFLHLDNNGAKPPDVNLLRFVLLNQVLVTVGTSPAGRQYTVDGILYNDSHQFSWTPGSSHALSTFSPQADSTVGIQYVFSGWSDGGAETHTIQPTASGSYTAGFGTEYYLTIGADLGGTTTPTSRWYASGASITITAVPPAGFKFLKWDGTGEGAYNGTENPAIVEMRGPVFQQARFEPAVGVSDELTSIPGQFVLAQNYPNPFNPATTIRYGLPERSTVRLAIFSQLGQLVEVLVNQVQEAGYHEVRFDAAGLPSGLYFYRIQTGNFSSTKKLLLIR